MIDRSYIGIGNGIAPLCGTGKERQGAGIGIGGQAGWRCLTI